MYHVIVLYFLEIPSWYGGVGCLAPHNSSSNGLEPVTLEFHQWKGQVSKNEYLEKTAVVDHENSFFFQLQNISHQSILKSIFNVDGWILLTFEYLVEIYLCILFIVFANKMKQYS